MNSLIKPRLRIAVQKAGRLNQPSMDFLSSCGLSFTRNGSSLILPCVNFDFDVLYLRDDDIPEYVRRGAADFGIVGQNVLAETDAKVVSLTQLGFAQCRLMIAVPAVSGIAKAKDLEGGRIATSYPNILSRFLVREGITAAIITISGSSEVAPELNLADAICDIVQSGETLKAHKLVPLCTIMESQAVLIESPNKNSKKKEFLNICKL